MPGPAIYVVAAVGTVAAGYAFKKVCYLPVNNARRYDVLTATQSRSKLIQSFAYMTLTPNYIVCLRPVLVYEGRGMA